MKVSRSGRTKESRSRESQEDFRPNTINKSAVFYSVHIAIVNTSLTLTVNRRSAL